MTDKEFYDIVKKLRAAQKAYFKNRCFANMYEMQGLETHVDLALRQLPPSDKPKVQQFRKMVADMRRMQDIWVKTKLHEHLKAALSYESKVDKEIERVENILHPKPIQTKLEL